MEKTIAIPDYELERGKPMPSKLHSRVQSNINFLLQTHYRERYDVLSELNLELDGWGSVPDLCVYPKMDYDFSEDEIRMTAAPLCTIEILSPTQSLQELIDKAYHYFGHGVKSCWLVIPALKNIYVFSGRETYQIFKANETLTDAGIGVTLPLSEIFK